MTWIPIKTELFLPAERDSRTRNAQVSKTFRDTESSHAGASASTARCAGLCLSCLAPPILSNQDRHAFRKDCDSHQMRAVGRSLFFENVRLTRCRALTPYGEMTESKSSVPKLYRKTSDWTSGRSLSRMKGHNEAANPVPLAKAHAHPGAEWVRNTAEHYLSSPKEGNKPAHSILKGQQALRAVPCGLWYFLARAEDLAVGFPCSGGVTRSSQRPGTNKPTEFPSPLPLNLKPQRSVANASPSAGVASN